MNRRSIFRMVLGMALVGAIAGVRPGRAAPPPKIVLITADNLGFHDTGCYGNSEIKTPNMPVITAVVATRTGSVYICDLMHGFRLRGIQENDCDEA